MAISAQVREAGFEEWLAKINSACGRFCARTLGPGFSGAMQEFRAHALRLSVVDAAQTRLYRTQQEIARSDGSHFFTVFQLRGSSLMEQGDHGDAAYYEAVVGLALLELQRARRSPIRIAMPVAADRRLINACQAVMASPSLDIPFEQHAEAAGASVRTLARLFQQHLGMGFAQWRRQVQLATAAAELIQGQPVSGIARTLGYSPSSFSDMFRRELGVSPSQYRSWPKS